MQIVLFLCNYNRANDVAVCIWPCVCGNRHLERRMTPSQKSQVMFASAFSRFGDLFRIVGIHSFLRYGMVNI